MVGKTRRRRERSAKRGKGLESGHKVWKGCENLLVAVKVDKELKGVEKVDKKL